VNAVMNLRVPYNAGKLSSGLTTGGLSSSAQLHRVNNNIFFYFPIYLQSVPVHSANVVKSCTKACRRVLTSTLLYLVGSESSCDLGSETYKPNLKNYIYNYILNLVGRSIGRFFRNHLVSGGSCRFKISSFGCTLRHLV
jgi:hypothetical protein